MTAKTVKILHRWNDTACWEGEIEDRGSDSLNLGEAVKRALASGANLDGANLRCASLDGASLDGANLRCASLDGASLDGASLDGANLRCASLRCANLRCASLDGANLDGANLDGANLRCASLDGASLDGKKISALRVFSGLYEYQIWAYVLEDGSPWVRMGCQKRSVAEWDVLTIRESRTSEYPNDGSARSERRARAFEFARGEASIMAQEVANRKRGMERIYAERGEEMSGSEWSSIDSAPSGRWIEARNANGKTFPAKRYSMRDPWIDNYGSYRDPIEWREPE